MEFEYESGSEIEDPEFDLDNFPDPGLTLCLEAHGIKTEDQFKEFWRKVNGQEIRKFQSFTPPGILK